MPVAPQVNKDFETVSGNRATVKIKFDKPDVNGILFAGTVKLNGDDQAAFWRATGESPDPNYTLDSLWPADDSRQYQPMIRSDEGVFRAMGSFYAELGSLKHDWKPRGAKYAVKFERGAGPHDPPTAEIVSLA